MNEKLRIGVMVSAGGGLAKITDRARKHAPYGFAHYWLAQPFGVDVLTALALIAPHLPEAELGTAVIPIYGRHPLTLAMQALTTQAATGGRLALGIGLSHQFVIENIFGMPFTRPARHMREYVSALAPLLRREKVEYAGETVRVNTVMGPLDVGDATPPRLLLAALGPVMLDIAGRMADGTITWMTGARTLASHTVPTITAAARAAGRPAPRILAGLPVCVTSDVDAARKLASEQLAVYRSLPFYRAMMDREGAADPVDIAQIGDRAALQALVQRLRDAGVTDLLASVVGPPATWTPTLESLAELK
ncbi:MAG: TIGR03564 family F420-dependent LLM class oxidoreductase [Gammaproteobacteria bacterium]